MKRYEINQLSLDGRKAKIENTPSLLRLQLLQQKW